MFTKDDLFDRIQCDVCGITFRGPGYVVLMVDRYGDPVGAQEIKACNVTCMRKAPTMLEHMDVAAESK